ncbi:MAG TPA: hypothetical protein VJX94_02295 [Stellaceae bacterium]|nr:hypothetical protein [Stellaceae bacterium]
MRNTEFGLADQRNPFGPQGAEQQVAVTKQAKIGDHCPVAIRFSGVGRRV